MSEDAARAGYIHGSPVGAGRLVNLMRGAASRGKLTEAEQEPTNPESGQKGPSQDLGVARARLSGQLCPHYGSDIQADVHKRGECESGQEEAWLRVAVESHWHDKPQQCSDWHEQAKTKDCYAVDLDSHSKMMCEGQRAGNALVGYVAEQDVGIGERVRQFLESDPAGLPRLVPDWYSRDIYVL